MRNAAVYLDRKSCGDVWLHVAAPSGTYAMLNLGRFEAGIGAKAVNEVARLGADQQMTPREAKVRDLAAQLHTCLQDMRSEYKLHGHITDASALFAGVLTKKYDDVMGAPGPEQNREYTVFHSTSFRNGSQWHRVFNLSRICVAPGETFSAALDRESIDSVEFVLEGHPPLAQPGATP